MLTSRITEWLTTNLKPRVRAVPRPTVHHVVAAPNDAHAAALQFIRDNHKTPARLPKEVADQLQVYVPLLFGRSESELRDPSAVLETLSALATRLVPRQDDQPEAAAAGDDAIGASPWKQRAENSKPQIILVQGPAGSGKSMFVWNLYSRFGALVRCV